MTNIFRIAAVILLASIATSSQCQSSDSTSLSGSVAMNKVHNWPTGKDSLPEPVGWVNDFEGLFTPEQTQKLDSLIDDFEYKTSIEIAIVTADTTLTSEPQFENWLLHVSNSWGVGKKYEDNGIVIGISTGCRKMRIENGDGIVRLISDSETQKLVNTDFIPYFDKSSYYEGTLHGLETLMAKLSARIKELEN